MAPLAIRHRAEDQTVLRKAQAPDRDFVAVSGDQRPCQAGGPGAAAARGASGHAPTMLPVYGSRVRLPQSDAVVVPCRSRGQRPALGLHAMRHSGRVCSHATDRSCKSRLTSRPGQRGAAEPRGANSTPDSGSIGCAGNDAAGQLAMPRTASPSLKAGSGPGKARAHAKFKFRLRVGVTAGRRRARQPL